MIANPDSILKHICEKLSLNIEDVVSQSRKRELVEARQIGMALMCIYTKLTLKRIGEIFGGRDHTTVIYSRETFKDLYQTDKDFRAKVDDILPIFA